MARRYLAQIVTVDQSIPDSESDPAPWDITRAVFEARTPDGQLIAEQEYTPSGVASGLSSGAINCLKDGDSGVQARTPVSVDHQEWVGAYQFIFYPYTKSNARKVNDKLTWQVEVCATGGAQPSASAGHQVEISGPQMFFRGLDNDEQGASLNRKIDQDWEEASTPANSSTTVGFKLSAGVVEISGSITQHAEAKLTGSITAPIFTGWEDYYRNTVTAWWEDGCWRSSNLSCNVTAGSSYFHGASAQGLWEMPMTAVSGKAAQFQYRPIIVWICKNSLLCDLYQEMPH